MSATNDNIAIDGAMTLRRGRYVWRRTIIAVDATRLTDIVETYGRCFDCGANLAGSDRLRCVTCAGDRGNHVAFVVKSCGPRPAKITADDVVAIRKAAADGETQDSIAKRYGLSQSHISRIVARTSRRNVS